MIVSRQVTKKRRKKLHLVVTARRKTRVSVHAIVLLVPSSLFDISSWQHYVLNTWLTIGQWESLQDAKKKTQHRNLSALIRFLSGPTCRNSSLHCARPLVCINKGWISHIQRILLEWRFWTSPDCVWTPSILRKPFLSLSFIFIISESVWLLQLVQEISSSWRHKGPQNVSQPGVAVVSIMSQCKHVKGPRKCHF